MGKPIAPTDMRDMGKTGAALFANMPPMGGAVVPSSESPVVRALRERPRPVTMFPVPAFAKHLDDPNATVGIRIATITEQDDALQAAYAYIDKRSATTPSLARDPDFVTHAKTVHILSEVVRDATSPDMRAFPDAQWMMDNFTPYELRVLLDKYNSVVQASQPGGGKVEPQWVAELAEKCAEFESTGVADAALAECSRDMLAEMFVRLAMLYRTEREENDALRAVVAEYEGQAGQSGSPQTSQAGGG